MTKFSLVLAPGAEDDVSNALLWYRDRNALAANAFRSEVFETIERIGDAPLGRSPDVNGNRNRVLKHFPYTVWYEVHDQIVTILAVAHHRRRPDYWRDTKR